MKLMKGETEFVLQREREVSAACIAGPSVPVAAVAPLGDSSARAADALRAAQPSCVGLVPRRAHRPDYWTAAVEVPVEEVGGVATTASRS